MSHWHQVLAPRRTSAGYTGLPVPRVAPWPTLAPLRAVGRVVLAVDAAEARGAGAGVAVHTVGAVGAVAAGAAGTLIQLVLAVPAPEAPWTHALVAIHQVLGRCGAWGEPPKAALRHLQPNACTPHKVCRPSPCKCRRADTGPDSRRRLRAEAQVTAGPPCPQPCPLRPAHPY